MANALGRLDEQIAAALVGDDKFDLAIALQSVRDAFSTFGVPVGDLAARVAVLEQKGAALVKAVDQAAKTPETVPQPK